MLAYLLLLVQHMMMRVRVCFWRLATLIMCDDDWSLLFTVK